MTDKFWTQDRDSRLKHMWINGVPVIDIAKKLNAISKNSVVSRAHRLKLPAHSGAVYKTKSATKKIRWNRKLYEQLMLLWSKGHGIDEICKYFKTTKYEIHEAIKRARASLYKKESKKKNKDTMSFVQKPIRAANIVSHKCSYCSMQTYIKAKACYHCAYRAGA